MYLCGHTMNKLSDIQSANPSKYKLITCLGNPGEKYQNNRHNAGFLASREIIKCFELTKEGKKFSSLIYKGKIQEHPIILIKPATYMNLSGTAVQDVLNFYKIPIENLIVIYDDVDLNLGSIRIKPKGSAGTHNGMKSIIQNLKTDNFTRIRIGIGPKPENYPLDQFVLSNFTNDEIQILNTILPEIPKILTNLFIEDIERTMTKFN